MPATALPIDARSVAAARRLLRTALDGHQPSTIEDAVLMISELVTNAVRHTHDVLLVLITIHHHTLRVDVSDDNPTLPTAPAPEHNATNGRGLGIVNALADRWGITPTADGKSVWFEIDVGEPSRQWDGPDARAASAQQPAVDTSAPLPIPPRDRRGP